MKRRIDKERMRQLRVTRGHSNRNVKGKEKRELTDENEYKRWKNRRHNVREEQTDTEMEGKVGAERRGEERRVWVVGMGRREMVDEKEDEKREGKEDKIEEQHTSKDNGKREKCIKDMKKRGHSPAEHPTQQLGRGDKIRQYI